MRPSNVLLQILQNFKLFLRLRTLTRIPRFAVKQQEFHSFLRVLQCALVPVALALSSVLFWREFTADESRHEAIPDLKQVPRFQKPTYSQRYIISKLEEDGISKLISEIRSNLTGKLLLESVDCDFANVFRNFPQVFVTRTLGDFDANDDFANHEHLKHDHRMTIICDNRTTGIHTKFDENISLMARQRTDTASLLVTFTNQHLFYTDGLIARRRTYYQRIVFYVHNAKKAADRHWMLSQTFSAGSLGYVVTPVVGRQRCFSLSNCTVSWLEFVRKNRTPSHCSSVMSKYAVLRSLKKRSTSPGFSLRSSSKTEPCFNASLNYELIVDARDDFRLPHYVDDGVSAYTHTRAQAKVDIQGRMINLNVVLMYTLLVGCLCVISDMPFVEVFLEIVFGSIGSTTISSETRDRLGIAILLLLVSMTFFSLILQDDMTSRFHVIQGDRVAKLKTCGVQYHMVRSNGTFERWNGYPAYTVLLQISQATKWAEVICANREQIADIDQLLGSLGIFYKIPLESPEQRWKAIKDVLEIISSKAIVDGVRREIAVTKVIDNTEWSQYATLMLRYGLLKMIMSQDYHRMRGTAAARLRKEQSCKIRCLKVGAFNEFMTKLLSFRGKELKMDFPLYLFWIGIPLCMAVLSVEIMYWCLLTGCPFK